MQQLNSPKFPRSFALRGAMEPISITTVLIGAAVGAVGAAVTGGNILKGALLGAVGGAIGSAFAGAGTALEAGGAVAGGAAEGAAASAISSEAAGAAALDAMGTGAFVEGGVSPFATAAGASGSTAAVPMAVGDTVTTAGQTALGGAGSSTSIAAPTAQTTLAGSGTDTALSGAGSSTGIMPSPNDVGGFTQYESGQFAADKAAAAATGGPAPQSPFNTASSSPSTFSQIWDKLSNSRMASSVAGQGLMGLAQGAAADKQVQAQKQLIAEQRANARYGTVASRYTPVGLIGQSNFHA